jgi:hypothetical protein
MRSDMHKRRLEEWKKAFKSTAGPETPDECVESPETFENSLIDWSLNLDFDTLIND